MSKTKPENHINIHEIQRDNLAKELAALILKLKKEISVECIYITPSIKLEGNDNRLEITVVRNSFAKWNKEEWVDKNNNFYKRIEAIKKFGVLINIFVDDKRYYTTNPLNPSECRREIYLLNANILLDKKGDYTKIKEQAEKYIVKGTSSLYYYNNLAEIQPPLIDRITSELEVKEKQSQKNITNQKDTKILKK